MKFQGFFKNQKLAALPATYYFLLSFMFGKCIICFIVSLLKSSKTVNLHKTKKVLLGAIQKLRDTFLALSSSPLPHVTFLSS